MGSTVAAWARATCTGSSGSCGSVAARRAAFNSASLCSSESWPSPMSSMRRAIAYTADNARRLAPGSSRMPHAKLRACSPVICSHMRYAAAISAGNVAPAVTGRPATAARGAGFAASSVSRLPREPRSRPRAMRLQPRGRTDPLLPEVLSGQVHPSRLRVLPDVLAVLEHLQRVTHDVRGRDVLRGGASRDMQHDLTNRRGRVLAVAEQIFEGGVPADRLVHAIGLDQVEQ